MPFAEITTKSKIDWRLSLLKTGDRAGGSINGKQTEIEIIDTNKITINGVYASGEQTSVEFDKKEGRITVITHVSDFEYGELLKLQTRLNETDPQIDKKRILNIMTVELERLLSRAFIQLYGKDSNKHPKSNPLEKVFDYLKLLLGK